MSEREVYHVVRAGESGWKVTEEGSPATLDHAETKDAAVELAVQRAKKAKLGQVKIHRDDGSFEEERTFGEDPRRTPG